MAEGPTRLRFRYDRLYICFNTGTTKDGTIVARIAFGRVRARMAVLVSLLPVRLEDLIHVRTVESVRIDFKAGWNR